jgi:hypothetical protein
MIDKIVIKLNDSGQFEVNVGDILHSIEQTPMECMRTVNNHLRKLAYFPTHKNDILSNPKSFDEFKKSK